MLKEIAQKLSSTENNPVVRVRGIRKSKRTMNLFFPKSENGIVRTIQFSEYSKSKFSIASKADDKFTLMFNDEEVVDFDTRQEAIDVLHKIVSELAPSRWRTARRLLGLWFVYWIFFGSQAGTQPNQMASQFKVPATATMPQDQQIRPQMPVQQTQSSNQSVGVVDQGNTPQAAPGDPFGLRISPESK